MKLEISDGQRSIDLLSGGSIYAVQEGFDLPLPGRDATFIESVDVDGRRRIRTRNSNGEGRIAAMISGTSDANFWDNIDNILELVESAHRNRGSLTYTPPGGSEEITWDLEAITVTGLPQKGQQLATRRAECEIALETRPYGKLAATAVDLGGTAVVLDGPIDYAPIGGIAGQIEAFADLKLTELSGQPRDYVEIGLQDRFDPNNAEPLLLTAGSMSSSGGTLVGLAGVAGTAQVPTGAFTVSGTVPYGVTASVANLPVAILTTGDQTHSGLWKVRARVNASDAAIRIRLAWRVGQGSLTREQWRIIPNANAWVDIDLGTIDIPKQGSQHFWEGRVEGVGEVGFPKITVDYLSFIPCDNYIQLRGQQVIESASPIIGGDDFQSHAAGTLNGKTPPLTLAGNWTTGGGSIDFSVVTSTSNVVTRAGTNDANVTSGRSARFGTVNLQDLDFSTELLPRPSIGGTYIDYPGSPSGTLGDFSRGQAGVVFRYKDANNHVKAFYTTNIYQRQVNVVRRFGWPNTDIPGAYDRFFFGGTFEASEWLFSEWTERSIVTEFSYLSLHLQKVVGGTVTSLGRVDYGPIEDNSTNPIGGIRSLRVTAGTAGDIEVWEGAVGSDLKREITYPGDGQLATGGTLETGQLGLYHANTRGTVDDTGFLGITVKDPSPDTNSQPALRPDSVLQVTSSGAFTLSGTADAGSPTPIIEGQYPTIQPATRNNNQSRLVVRARRKDLSLGEEDTGLGDQLEPNLEAIPRVNLQ